MCVQSNKQTNKHVETPSQSPSQVRDSDDSGFCESTVKRKRTQVGNPLLSRTYCTHTEACRRRLSHRYKQIVSLTLHVPVQIRLSLDLRVLFFMLFISMLPNSSCSGACAKMQIPNLPHTQTPPKKTLTMAMALLSFFSTSPNILNSVLPLCLHSRVLAAIYSGAQKRR